MDGHKLAFYVNGEKRDLLCWSCLPGVLGEAELSVVRAVAIDDLRDGQSITCSGCGENLDTDNWYEARSDYEKRMQAMAERAKEARVL